MPPSSLRKNSINSRKVFFDVAENKVKTINIKNIAFVIRVGKVLFQDIILNSVEIIRKFLSKLKEFDATSRVLACNFLSGLIMGDGTIGLGKDSKNRTNFFIEIKDPDILNLRECKKLFDKLGFNSNLDDSNSLPRLLIWRCKWDLLVWVLFKNRMLVETPFNWIKLILAITNMQQFKRFNRLVIFKRAVTSREISDVFNLDIKATQVWLRMKEKEGLVKRIDFIKGWGTNKLIWGLTEKGKEMQKLLIEINEFQRRIEDTFKVNSFVEVKELIKNNSNEDLSLKVAQS